MLLYQVDRRDGIKKSGLKKEGRSNENKEREKYASIYKICRSNIY